MLTISAGDQDRDFVYDWSKQFASCAGAYDVLSEYSTKNPEYFNDAEKLKGLANGAQMASAYIASAVVGWERAHEFAANLRESYRVDWAAYENGAVSSELEAELNKCSQLRDTQAKLIDDMRKEIYGFTQ